MGKRSTQHIESRLRNGPPLRPFHRSAVAVAVAAAIASSGALHAQTQAADKKDEPVLEEVVVTGFRASLMDAMDTKKKNTSIVEAISAEEIGKLPDVSIAESIARLPGLTAQRLNGRGQVISIRGLSPDFSTALLNGREQVSTGDNRSVEFDQFPSELLSGVVVYKTPDASLIGQGLSGTVDMRTVRPLEYGRQSLVANLRYEKADLGSLNAGSADDGLRYSLSYVDQFGDGTVGLALGFAHMSNPSQEQRFNAWGYPGGPGGALVIGGSKPYVRSGELTRDGVVGVLEFKPSDNFSAALDVYYSKFEEDQQLRGIELPLQWSSASLQPGYTTADGLITSGTFNGVRGVMRNDVNLRESKVTAAGLNLQFGLGEAWRGEADLSMSKVDRDDLILETYSGIPQASATADNLGFTMTDRGAVFRPTFNYGDASRVFLTSPQGWGGDVVPGGQLGYSNQPNIEDELQQIRLSAKRDVEFGPFADMQVGWNHSKRDKALVADEFFLGLASGAVSAPIPTVTGLTDLSFLGIPGMVSYDPRDLIGRGTYRLIRNPNGDVAVKSWSVDETSARSR
jgi:iron complex outermembrane receptor protein